VPATFIPFMAVVRPYLRPFGVALIIVGIFRGAQTVIKNKNSQLETVSSAKKTEVETLRAAQDVDIAALNTRIAELSRNPYSEDLERPTRQIIDQMTHEGHLLLRHLLMHQPIEVGRPFMPEISVERQNAQMAVAFKSGIVRHDEKRQGAMVWTYHVVTPNTNK
jgi:hypothetical protein